MDREAWDTRYASADLVWSAGPNQFLVSEVAGLEPGRALDLACGEGRNAIWLAEQGWKVIGVDFSPVALEKAHRLARARLAEVTWEERDVVTWAPPEGAFDLVLVFYLQLPAALRRVAFVSAARAVAPGGTLLVVGHDTDNLERGWGGPQSAEVLYGPADVVTDLAAVEGLLIGRAAQVERAVHTDDGPKVAIDVLVRASRPA